MSRYLRTAIVAFVALFLALQALPLSAQRTAPAPPAPVPARIQTANTVFIANAGWDEPSTDLPQYVGEPDRAYNQLYAALKASGRYKLAADPSDADLLFEIRFTIEHAVIRGTVLTSADIDPQLHLAIRDPKTNALLWAFTEHSPWAILQGNREKNLDQALSRIVLDLERLSAPPPAPDPDASKH